MKKLPTYLFKASLALCILNRRLHLGYTCLWGVLQ